jgi:hypothetical protein
MSKREFMYHARRVDKDPEKAWEQEKLRRKLTRRIRFWRTIRNFASAQWLKSHGWIEIREGWLLPDWHPKLQKRMQAAAQARYFGTKHPNIFHELGEPYDLKHACNSQEACTRNDVVMLPQPGQKAPTYPSYLTHRPFLPCVFLAATICNAEAVILRGHWSSSLFLAAAVALGLTSLWIGWKAKREWKLDWAEEKLNRRSFHEIHRPN